MAVTSATYQEPVPTTAEILSTMINTTATLSAYKYAVPVVCGLAVMLNLAVVISSGLILKKGQTPKATYILLGNVALSDLLTAASTIFGQLYPSEHREHYLCCVQLGLIVSSTLVSVYSVGLIAIDRFLYIVHGLKYQTWINPGRVRVAVGLSWLLGIIIGFLPLMGWHRDTTNGQRCWFIALAPNSLVALTVGVSAVPLALVVVLYSVILYRALQNVQRLRKTYVGSGGLRIFAGSPGAHHSRWRAIKVVMLTSGAFVLTWGPYFVACAVYVLTARVAGNEQLLATLQVLIASPFAVLGFFNTLIDPLIYAWWHRGFRSFVKKQVAFGHSKRAGGGTPTAAAAASAPAIHAWQAKRNAD